MAAAPAPVHAFPPDDNPPPEWAEHFGSSEDPMTFVRERLVFDDQAVGALLALTQKGQPVEARCGAIAELSKNRWFGRQKVRARIAELTRRGESAPVRIAAVHALSQPAAGAFPDTRDVLLNLSKAYDNENILVEAIRGLVPEGALSRESVRDDLSAIMESATEYTSVRVAAIGALRDSLATATDPWLREKMGRLCAEFEEPVEVKLAACGAY